MCIQVVERTIPKPMQWLSQLELFLPTAAPGADLTLRYTVDIENLSKDMGKALMSLLEQYKPTVKESVPHYVSDLNDAKSDRLFFEQMGQTAYTVVITGLSLDDARRVKKNVAEVASGNTVLVQITTERIEI